MAITNVGIIKGASADPSTRATEILVTPDADLTAAPAFCWQVAKSGTKGYTMSLAVTAVENGEEVWSATQNGWGSRNVAASKVGGAYWCRLSFADLVTTCNTHGHIDVPSWAWDGRTYDALKLTFVVKATDYPETRTSKDFAIRYVPKVTSAMLGATDGGFRIVAELSDGWAQAGSAFTLTEVNGNACSAQLDGTDDGDGSADLEFGADAVPYAPDLNAEANEIAVRVSPWYGGTATSAVSATVPSGDAPEPTATAERHADGSVLVHVDDVGASSYTVTLDGGGLPGDSATGAAGTYRFPAAPSDACIFTVTAYGVGDGGFLFAKSINVTAPPYKAQTMRLAPVDGGEPVRAIYDIETGDALARDSVDAQLAGRERPSVWFGEAGSMERSLSWRIPPDPQVRGWEAPQAEQLEAVTALPGATFVVCLPDGTRALSTTKSVDLDHQGGGIVQVSMTAEEVA